jgi:DNA-directed RNA polymerase specialized sigma24 family protein
VTYRPQLATTDILPVNTLQVGGGRHIALMDLLAALESEEEEDMLRLLLHGWTQAQVAVELGIHQTTVSRRLKVLVKRAA